MSNANKMLIDASHPEETRVAMVRGNQVDEFDFESDHKHQIRGNIYLAKVTRVEPSLQAAFVDYGGNRHGFLAFSEIHPDYYQIPLADRQALLEAEAKDAREAAEEDEDAGDESAEVRGDTTEQPAPKKRRRRRSKKAKGADDAPAAETTDEDSDDSGDEMNAENDGDDSVSEPATKHSGRVTRKAPVRKPAETKAVEETAAEVAPDKPAEPAPRPRRRTSRVPKAEKLEAVVAPEAEAAIAKPVEEPKEKPARKRRTKAAASKSDETTEATEDAASTDVSERVEAPKQADAAEEKPKRRRRSRAKKDVAPADDASEAENADSDAASVTERNEAARSDSTDDADNADAVAGKPKRPRRSRAKAKPAETETADESSDDDNGSAEPVETGGKDDALLEDARPPRRSARRHYKIQEVIKRRQILLVQVTKEERGNKGAALTTYLSLAGRYSVLMPNTARGGGISRKITNMADRKRLKKIAGELEVPQGMGVILRTAGAARTPAEIQRDFEYLMRLWENVRTLTLESTAPCLVYEEGSLIKRSIRDLYDKDTSEILVAGDAGYREAKDFMKMLMPSHARNVKRYKDKVPIFARMGVEAQLDAMLQPQVTLKSGGYLVINQTEALVAIDVNSGKSTRQHSVEETAIQTNLEAADEVARQLRLRDLAGLIVIDFIDMDNRGNVRKVEQRLKDALKNDRARIQVGRISHFGLMEMSRQRMRSSVLESTTQVCSHCEGLGYVRASSSVGLQVLRALDEHLNKSSRHDLTVKVTSDTALHLLNAKRASLTDLEDRFGVAITVEIDDHIGNVPCVIERGEQTARVPVAAPIQVDHVDDDEDDADTDGDAEETVAVSSPSQDIPASVEESDGEPKKRRKRRRRRGKRGSEDGENDTDSNGNADASETANDDSGISAASASGEHADGVDPTEEADSGSEVPTEFADASRTRRTTRTRRTKPAPKRPEPSEEAMPVESAGKPVEEPKRKPRRNTRRVEAEDTELQDSTVQDEGAVSASEVQSSETVSTAAESVAESASETDSKPKTKKAKSWWQTRFFS